MYSEEKQYKKCSLLRLAPPEYKRLPGPLIALSTILQIPTWLPYVCYGNICKATIGFSLSKSRLKKNHYTRQI